MKMKTYRVVLFHEVLGVMHRFVKAINVEEAQNEAAIIGNDLNANVEAVYLENE